MITNIVHPARFPNAKALLQCAGLGTRGKAVRPARGRRTPYNPEFKKALMNLALPGWMHEPAGLCHRKALYLAELERCRENHARSCSNPRCPGRQHAS